MRRGLILSALPLLIFAATAQADYYSDSQKGWWWGDREIVAEEKQEKPAKPPKEKKGKNKPYVPPALSTYSYESVWNMHPDRFLEFQEAYKKKAVQSPTEDNVRDYYELSEIARKKALAFQNTSKYVWQKHPELTVAKDYPINTPGNLTRIGSINNEKLAKLKDNRDNYALIYFWQPGCTYCDDQKNILRWFQDKTDWIVKPVNIQESPMLANKVGVNTTPTIILIKKGQEEFFPVSSGVASADEIEEKAYRAVRVLNKEITPEEYSNYEFQKGGGFDVNSRKDWLK